MKKISLLMALVMLVLCISGCVFPETPDTTKSQSDTTGSPSEPTSTEPPTEAPIDPTTESPTEPTEPEPTNPTPTEPKPTEPTPTNPDPTDPTEPTPSKPSGETLSDPVFLPGPTLLEKYGTEITSDEADLRQMVVDYMYAMANIRWTATVRLDYSSNASSSLVYEIGKTYLGMVYNNNQNGLEAFQDILDGNNTYIGTDTGWNTSPGNSCATSIRHAWQQVSPTADFDYSADMMPYYSESGVIGIGNIDWSTYDGSNTNSIVQAHDAQTIFQAYAEMLPGDALVRYLDNGGHALMATKAPTVVYNADGTIDANSSYVYLTDQNNRLHNRREYPSSWEVDRAVSFASALADGYLPVTTVELRDGKTPTPTFELTTKPTVSAVQKGTVKGTVKSNYCINTLRMEIYSGDTVVASAVTHPYKRTCGFSALGKTLNITELPEGKYTLVITAEVAFGTQTLVEMEFLRG